MNDEQTDKFEQRIRFVAKHYREGAFDAEGAWKKFASGKHLQPTDASGESSLESRLSDPGFSGTGHAGSSLTGSGGQRTAFSIGRYFRRYGVAVAAVICLLIGWTVFYRVYRDQPDWVVVTTGPDQTKEVWLPDSTLLSMAGRSEIRYDRKVYGKERRVVEMKGKVFFEVQREEARPFSVYTPHTKVTVLGTRFQVDEQKALTEICVESGKVSFSAGKEANVREVILTAGMSARYVWQEQALTVEEETDPNFLSWKTGELRFKDTPLDRVIETLNTYYGVKVRNASSASGIKLTATFHLLPLDEVLTVINQTLDTRLTADPVR